MSYAAPRGVLRLDAADLVVTAGAASTLEELDAALAPHDAWIALDPPGPRTRSLGAALHTGAPGPLAARFGPPRDQVIGLTFLAGDGTTVHTGGRVVKNVAGFDLAKLVVGGHGAFGIIMEAHLRLRARPASDVSRAWIGSRDGLERAAARLLASGSTLAACELVSPDLAATMGLQPRWTLLARSSGTADGVSEELEAAQDAIGADGESVSVPAALWRVWSEAVGGWPAAARIGADPARIGEAMTLAQRHGASGLSVTIPRGTLRARFGEGAAAEVRALRESAAGEGWPLTIERAEEALMREVGIWGELPAESLEIARRLRTALGPGGTQEIPLWLEP